jgi:TetR/AcrR family fatty acid metabolism transcriptional regulator
MKLHSFITLHFLNYLSKRNFYKIFLTYVLYNQRFWDSHKYDFFRHYAGVLYPLLEEGTKEGVFRSDINSRLYRNLLLGAFSHISNRWIFFEENNKVDNMQEMDEAVQLLSLAVIANPKILEAESTTIIPNHIRKQ